jgi:hypothetical protein
MMMDGMGGHRNTCAGNLKPKPLLFMFAASLTPCPRCAPHAMISFKAIFLAASAAVFCISLLIAQLPVSPGRFLLPPANSGNM